MSILGCHHFYFSDIWMLELVLQGTFIWQPMWHWWKPLVEHWLQGAVVFSGGWSGWSRSIRLGDTLRTRGIFEKKDIQFVFGVGETWWFTHAAAYHVQYTFRICRLGCGYTNIRQDMFRTRRRSKPKAPPNKPPTISITVEASSWVSLFLGLISTETVNFTFATLVPSCSKKESERLQSLGDLGRMTGHVLLIVLVLSNRFHVSLRHSRETACPFNVSFSNVNYYR